MLPIRPYRRSTLLSLALLIGFGGGCSSKTAPNEASVAKTTETGEPSDATETESPYVFEAQAYESSPEQLLAARLPLDESTDGWIRLFDGHTLFGWAIAGEANWRIEDGAIVVDRGSQCLLTTTTQWSDFELELEYQADEGTNSGVFVRTTLDPKDAAVECYEVNIAPEDNPFPTGGIVMRKKGKPFQVDADQWHVMTVICEGENLSVQIDGETTVELDDASTPSTGYIGLQHRTGAVRFRNVRIRPLGLKSLLDQELASWTRFEDMEGEFRVNDEGDLVVDGGSQQLETKESYGDFTLLAEYQMEDAKSNSGIFFRCIPGDVMMGYECQVSNEMIDGNPLQPADCGTGGIFRRQDARVVAGEPSRWNSILLKAQGRHFAAWVNGLQVSDVYDDREADENPRKGTRLDPGTIMVQGHDPSTQATYRKFEIQAD